MLTVALAKNAISQISAMGAGRIVGQIVTNNVTPTNSIDKVIIVFGRYGLGALAGGAVYQTMTQHLDEIEETVKNFNKQEEAEEK